MNSSSNVNYPEISVLMSCYNASRWLHEAINSILEQTFKNFELILIDDGSKDETWVIIQNYHAHDNRIIAISKENTGLADSLNMGINQAKGKWIARLDADDLCEVTRLEEQFYFVSNHPEVVLLGTGFLEIDDRDKVVKKHFCPTNHRQLVNHLERMRKFFPHSSAFYLTEMVRHVGGYNLWNRKAEDRDLWMKLALRGKIACLPNALVRVRKHSRQLSHENKGHRQLYDGIAATVCHFLRKEDYQDPSVAESEEEWASFLCWLENCVDAAGLVERYNAWAKARTEYFAPENKFIGWFCFSKCILQSGYANKLVWEKLFGSSLAQRLASEWMKRSGNEK